MTNYYDCWICGREVEIPQTNGRDTRPILIDGNGLWMCPECYKKHGKPPAPQTRIILHQKGNKTDWGEFNFLLSFFRFIFRI